MEHIEHWFDIHENEYLEFKRIENPPTLRPDLCAMIYLDKLFPSKLDMIAAAEHDEVYLQAEVDKLTEEDVIYLRRCGVCLSEDNTLYIFT